MPRLPQPRSPNSDGASSGTSSAAGGVGGSKGHIYQQLGQQQHHHHHQQRDHRSGPSGSESGGASNLIAPPQLNEPSSYDYTEALSSLLSTLETRRASVRAHMSRLVRGMADQLDINQVSLQASVAGPSSTSAATGTGTEAKADTIEAARAGALASNSKALGSGTTSSNSGNQTSKAPGATVGAGLMAAVEDIQRGAERALSALDAVHIKSSAAEFDKDEGVLNFDKGGPTSNLSTNDDDDDGNADDEGKKTGEISAIASK